MIKSSVTQRRAVRVTHVTGKQEEYVKIRGKKFEGKTTEGESFAFCFPHSA